MKNDKKQKPSEKPSKEKKEEQIKEEEILGELVPTELAEVMKTVPKQVRERFFGMFQSSVPKSSPFHEMIQKFTPEHIDKFLDYSHKEDENEYRLKSSDRNYNLAYIIIVVLFLLFLVVFLAKENQELLSDIIKILIGFGGGFGGGYGYRAYKEKKK